MPRRHRLLMRRALLLVLGLALGGAAAAAEPPPPPVMAALARGVNLPIWFAVLTLFVLAQVFREGAAMREEQKMTI